MRPYAKLPFYPGHVSIPDPVGEALAADYGPPRFSKDFLADYASAGENLRLLLGTRNDVILPTGEAMLGLWGALKCTLRPGDAMVSVGTGVYGDGFGDMAASMGCIVEKISVPYDRTLTPEDLERVDKAICRLKPVVITAVHCETPSGTLNPLDQLGLLKKDRNVPLFIVDAVASVGGAPVRADAWNVDIILGGSQKCLACPADMSILEVSEAAWERVEDVGYHGYEALQGFRLGSKDAARLPYAPNWNGVAALKVASRIILDEGLEAAFARHERVARQCRAGLSELGLALWTAPQATNSPTVTAVKIPPGFTWPEWRDALAARGLIVGGSFGPMNGKVFRLGHMGPQANAAKIDAALEVMAQTLNK